MLFAVVEKGMLQVTPRIFETRSKTIDRTKQPKGYQVNLKRELQKQSCVGFGTRRDERFPHGGRDRLRRKRIGMVLIQHQEAGAMIRLARSMFSAESRARSSPQAISVAAEKDRCRAEERHEA